MDTNSYVHFLIIKATIEYSNQEAAEKQMDTDEKLTQLTETLNNLTLFMMGQTNNSNSHQPRRIHRLLQILPLWSRLTRLVHHW